MDFKKAFGSVSRDLLWEKSVKLGISNNIHMIINALYTNTGSVININHNLFPLILWKQGWPLSPTLLIDALIDDLHQEADEITFEMCH